MSSHSLDLLHEKTSDERVRDGTELRRQLKKRHITMISMGGVIGTGLFMGTAAALKNGGPIGLLLGYTFIGTICYSVMISLGEMIAYLPIPGGHIRLADRFVNRSLAFAMGWTYWYNWTVALPAELSAAALIIDYWKQKINNAAWVTVCLVVVVGINLLGAGMYGEAEFIFASIKVITITGLLILGVILDLGGGPSHDRLGFRYWNDPGPFVQFQGIAGVKGRFLGWWAVTTQAAFSFMGTEIVAMAAGEAKNPRKILPKAIKRVYIRILLFYIGGSLIIGLLVPSNDPRLVLDGSTAAASPFVIAISTAGITGLPSLINAALLTAACSAASSDIFTSSRAIYGLAISGHAPKIFARTARNGLPWVAVIFNSCFGLLAYMAIDKNAGKVFTWFSSMASISGLMTWFGISLTYIRFYKGMEAQGIGRSKLPYSSSLQPFAAWYSMILIIVVCFFSGFKVFLKGAWASDVFITNYLLFIMFPILYFGTRYFYYNQPMISPEHMDFTTGVQQIEADTFDDPPPRNLWEKFWDWTL